MLLSPGNYDPSVSAEPLTFKLKKADSAKDSSLKQTNAISGLDYASDSEDNQEDKKDKVIDEKAENVEKDSANQKSGFPSLVGFLPPAIAAQPKIYQEEEEDKEKKKREEEAKKRQEETNKLRDKLAAKAREKMVLVWQDWTNCVKSCGIFLGSQRKSIAARKETKGSSLSCPASRKEDLCK